MAARVTKNDVEVLVGPSPSPRITKLDVEVIFCPDPARVTKLDIEVIVSGFPEEFIDSNAVSSSENFGNETNLFSESTIDDGYVDSDENLGTSSLNAQNEIFPSSITTQETFKRQRMYPTPYNGTSYIWIEKPISIETDLNFRKKS